MVKEVFISPQTLTGGHHVLTFKNRGKNAGSKGYFFGFDAILLQKK